MNDVIVERNYLYLLTVLFEFGFMQYYTVIKKIYHRFWYAILQIKSYFGLFWHPVWQKKQLENLTKWINFVNLQREVAKCS